MKDRIDPLLFDRAPWLAGTGHHVAMMRALLNKGLSYDKTIAVGRALRDLTAHQIMDTMGQMLARHTATRGSYYIPPKGAALIVANHPTGIADGIILHHAISRIRRDAYYFANRDVLKVLPQMHEIIAPVEWQRDRRSRASTRQTMAYVRRAIEGERLGVIFPSGRLAQRRGLRLHERPWMTSAAALARKFDLPVTPVHIAARNSSLFYLLDLIHPSLRDITLFHETLNKSRQPFAITAGPPIPPQSLPADAEAATQMLRDAVLTLGVPKDGRSVSLVRATRRPRIIGGV